MKYVINLVAIVVIALISMSMMGCSVVQLAAGSSHTVEKYQHRQLDSVIRKDVQLGFNTSTRDDELSLSISLKYRPYYDRQRREVRNSSPSSRFSRAQAIISLIELGALAYVYRQAAEVTEDGANVSIAHPPLETVGQASWSLRDALWVVPIADALLTHLIKNRQAGTTYGPWESVEPVTGRWEGLTNHAYRIDLPTYQFGKAYRSTSGTDNIPLREFLNGIKLQNPISFREQDAFTLRVSTKLDGRTYEKPLTISTQTGLRPFRDAANTALGFNITDTGTPVLSPRAEAVAHWTRGTVQAGQTATLTVTVKNTGKGNLFRVKALTVSSDRAFNNKELRFGKIVPGESKTLQYTFKIDKLMRTRDISLRIRFSEDNDYVPEDIPAKLQVIEQPRPKFDYNYRVVDGDTQNSVGNGDGIFQRGESVDIRVTVRNSGVGAATGVNTRLKLRKASGVTQYGDSTVRFFSLAPGASRTATFNIGVTPRSTARSLTLDLAVTEEIFGTEVRLDDKITLPIGQVAAPKIAVLNVEATIIAERTTLRDGADGSTLELAEIPKNTRVHITGQLGDWYRVELGELTGWVRTRDLTTRTVPTTPGPGTQNQKVQIVEVYQNQAPVVTLVEPTQSRVRVEGRTLTLTATAVDDKGIARVKLTVNGEVIEKAGRGMRAAAPRNRTIKETIPLTYGENRIRLVVYDTDNQASEPLDLFATRTREQPRQDYALLFATDRYDAWQPLKNPIHDARTVGNELQNRYGFSVELVRNPTRKQIFEKLLKYTEKRYNADDQLLIFFAGHGHFVEGFGAGYLIAGDSMRAAQDPGMTTAIQHTQLHQIIDNIRCEHIFLVIDACFSGTFDERVAQRGGTGDTLYEGVEPAEFIKRTLAIKTRWYLTSGGKEYVPDGKPGAHSPFARRLLEALRSDGGKDGILTLNELEGYVEKTKPKPQSGEFGDNEPGSNFLFIRK